MNIILNNNFKIFEEWRWNEEIFRQKKFERIYCQCVLTSRNVIGVSWPRNIIRGKLGATQWNEESQKW